MRHFLHRATPSPAMVVATAALFAALGGTSYAALAGPGKTASDCSRGGVEGSALIGANSSFPTSFTKVSGFNCSGEAIEARLVRSGDYEVKFIGDQGTIAVASLDDPKTEVNHDLVTITRGAPGVFYVREYDARTTAVGGQERPLGGAAVASTNLPFSIVAAVA